MTAKESSVRSFGPRASGASRRRSFPKLLPRRISLIWMRARTFLEARWRLLSVQSSRCCGRLMICLGLRSSKLCGWFIALFFADADIWAATSWYPSITHRAVFYEFMHEIFTLLYCWCSNQPSDSTPPLPFMCDACKSSSSSPAIFFFFCRALIKGLQVSRYVRAV